MSIIRFIKKFLTFFFVVLGVVFFIIILAGVYLYVADPFELKPLLFGSRAENGSSSEGPAFLSEAQKSALKVIGIDPANLPSEFTPE